MDEKLYNDLVHRPTSIYMEIQNYPYTAYIYALSRFVHDFGKPCHTACDISVANTPQLN